MRDISSSPWGEEKIGGPLTESGQCKLRPEPGKLIRMARIPMKDDANDASASPRTFGANEESVVNPNDSRSSSGVNSANVAIIGSNSHIRGFGSLGENPKRAKDGGRCGFIKK